MSPITYRLHADLRLLITTWVGEVTDRDVLAAYRAAYADRGWSPGFNEITDLRHAHMRGVTADGLRRVEDLVKQSVAGVTGGFRTAVLAPTDLEFGLARMYEMLSEDSPEAVRVFRDATAAAEWVGVPVGVLDEDPDPLG